MDVHASPGGKSGLDGHYCPTHRAVSFDEPCLSVFPRTVNIWNSLPDCVVYVTHVNTFKAHLDTFWQHQQVI